VLAFLMLLFIFRMILLGYAIVFDWRYESVLLIACGAIWSVAAPSVIIAALWLLGSRGHSRKALTVGGWAIMASGTVFVTSVAAHVLPCSGPS
jgi:hypothetical protein